MSQAPQDQSARAARTDGRGGLVFGPQPRPDLGEHEVQVAVAAVGLNFRDVYFVRGNAFRAANHGGVPTTDAAGTITRVGSGVTRFSAGDRVLTTVLPGWIDGPLSPEGFARSPGSAGRDGYLSTLIQLDEQELVATPRTLSDVEAACLPVAALTAWHAVAEVGAVRAGDTVVVQTTGGVSTFAIQFAAALGAEVIVTSRSAAKLEQAHELGAAQVVNTTLTPDWDDEVLALTGGRGAQFVVDMGLEGGLRRSARAAAFEATIAVVGAVQTETTALDIYVVMNKNLRLRGVETGSRSMFERMNQFIDEHGLKPTVDSTFDWHDAQLGLDRIARSPFGKVVLTM